MSRQGDIISTIFYRLAKEKWETAKAVKFAFDVLCDAGQIGDDDIDGGGSPTPACERWLAEIYKSTLDRMK